MGLPAKEKMLIAEMKDKGMSIEEIAKSIDMVGHEGYIKELLDEFTTPNDDGEGARLFYDLITELKKYLYFRAEWHYKILGLFIMETYFVYVLPAVFYVGLVGGKDTGKTTALEVINDVSYFGLLTGNVSPPALARSLNEGCTLCVDELDEMPKEIKMIVQAALRQGYRRGTYYMRWDIDGKRLEKVRIFGPKAISFRSEIEDALQSRTFPLPMVCAPDLSYSLSNMTRDLSELRTKLEDYARRRLGITPSHWVCVRCGNKTPTKPSGVCDSDLGGCGKDDKNTKFEFVPPSVTAKLSDFINVTEEEFQENVKGMCGGRFGRNVELAAVCLMLGKMIGVQVVEEFAEANRLGLLTEMEDLVILQEVVSEMVKSEIDNMGVKLVDNGSSDVVKLKQVNIRRRLNEALVKEEMHAVGDRTFAKLRRELGIPDDMLYKRNNRLYWALPYPWLLRLPWLLPLHNEEKVAKVAKVAYPWDISQFDLAQLSKNCLDELGARKDPVHLNAIIDLVTRKDKRVSGEKVEAMLKQWKQSGEVYCPKDDYYRLV